MNKLIFLLYFTIAYTIGTFGGFWLFGRPNREGRMWLLIGYILGVLIIIKQ